MERMVLLGLWATPGVLQAPAASPAVIVRAETRVQRDLHLLQPLRNGPGRYRAPAITPGFWRRPPAVQDP